MQQFEWAVVGAGPAGISTVGTLLDQGVDGSAIVWIDPSFSVGDFGTLWRNVPSNTRVIDFYQMFEACRSFEFEGRASGFAIEGLPKDGWCDLRYVAEPLEAVTATLRSRVESLEGYAIRCDSSPPGWVLHLRDGRSVPARNVVLAVGARARTLDLPGIEAIPLDVAMDRERLPATCTAGDTVAVFGSSHSAILAMMILVENCRVARIVNFYRSPLRFAVQFADKRWANYDTGLKGKVAAWAHQHLSGKDLPPNLERQHVNGAMPAERLGDCTKAIAAIGFEPRSEPVVTGLTKLEHDPNTGIIAPGLFGCGFAFPETATDEFGAPVQRVGLIRFARYLARVVPLWMA